LIGVLNSDVKYYRWEFYYYDYFFYYGEFELINNGLIDSNFYNILL